LAFCKSFFRFPSAPAAPALPHRAHQRKNKNLFGFNFFVGQGSFPACARTRALPRTARQMPKQFSPSPFIKRGQGGEVFFCQGGKARSSSCHSVYRLRQRPRRSRTGLTKTKNPAALYLPGPKLVSRLRQNPCTPAHGSPNAKTILPLSIHGEGAGGEVFFCQGGKARSSSGHSVPRVRQRPRRSRTGLTKEKTKTSVGWASSWPKARPPSAPEPVHSRARLAKCQNNSPPLHSWRGGRGVRSSSGSRCGHFSSQRQKILRAQRPFMVINSPQIPGPTHQGTHIFTRKFFQMVCQLLSEHRCLGVNNPGVVDWE